MRGSKQYRPRYTIFLTPHKKISFFVSNQEWPSSAQRPRKSTTHSAHPTSRRQAGDYQSTVSQKVIFGSYSSALGFWNCLPELHKPSCGITARRATKRKFHIVRNALWKGSRLHICHSNYQLAWAIIFALKIKMHHGVALFFVSTNLAPGCPLPMKLQNGSGPSIDVFTTYPPPEAADNRSMRVSLAKYWRVYINY